ELPPLGAIVLCAGVGLLLCSFGEALSRGTEAHAELVYWAGVLLFAAPIFYRLTGRAPSASERLLRVFMPGAGLYLVKVMRDSPSFTFNDELIHAFNTNQINTHHHLFHENPILAVTPFYPGMEGATSALTSITGISTYAAGTILIGAARLTLIASL